MMQQLAKFVPYCNKGCVIAINQSDCPAFVFDFRKLSVDEREELLDEIEFSSYEDIRDAIGEMTPFAVLYEDFYMKQAGKELSLATVLSDEVRPCGHLDLLLVDNESGRIAMIQEGDLVEIAENAEGLEVRAGA